MTVKAKKYGEVWLQEQKRAALLIKSFLYSHNVSDVLAGPCNTRQRDFAKVKAKIINFYIVKYGCKGKIEPLF